MAKLNFYFLNEYLVKGMNGLPVFEYEKDPVDTDDEFEEYIKECYCKKPTT